MLDRFRATYADLASPRPVARVAVRAHLPAPLLRAGLAAMAQQ